MPSLNDNYDGKYYENKHYLHSKKNKNFINWINRSNYGEMKKIQFEKRLDRLSNDEKKTMRFFVDVENADDNRINNSTIEKVNDKSPTKDKTVFNKSKLDSKESEISKVNIVTTIDISSDTDSETDTDSEIDTLSSEFDYIDSNDEMMIVDISILKLSQIVESWSLHKMQYYLVIDSRYPYEYEDGHVLFSKNIWEPIHVIRSLFLNDSNNDFEIDDDDLDGSLEKLFTDCLNTSCKHKRVILYDQLDISRARQLGELIATVNNFLVHKSEGTYKGFEELNVVSGGYKEFFEKFASYCDPPSYTEKIKKRGYLVGDLSKDDKLCSWRVTPAVCKLMVKLDRILMELYDNCVRDQFMYILDYIDKKYDSISSDE